MSAIKRYIDKLVEKGELDPVTLEPISKEEKKQSDFEEGYRISREEEEMMYWYWYMAENNKS